MISELRWTKSKKSASDQDLFGWPLNKAKVTWREYAKKSPQNKNQNHENAEKA